MTKGFLLSLITLFSFFNTQAQDVYWPADVSEINTGSNETYLIQSANLDGSGITYGYVLGAFYTDDDGNLQCGGFTNVSSNQTQLAAMGDDSTTEEKDGFDEGEEITWLAYGSFLEQTYTATITLITGSNTYSTNGLNIIANFNISSAVLGCMENTACNYNANATEDDDSCTYAEESYNCDGTCIDTDGDTVCDIDEIEGCMDATACNYNELATNEDNSCTAPETNFDCAGNCLNDTDNDGVCDENEIPGCSDITACNYDAAATDLDVSSCVYATGCESCEDGLIIDNDDDNDTICNDNEITGCTNDVACNYNTLATDDDESCVYATGDCDVCSGDTNGTGTIIDNDADNDGVCNDDEEGACVDATACNYNSNPTFESDSTLCIYITASCDDCSGAVDGTGTVIDNDSDNDGICNDAEIDGCTDETACNYDGSATELDASCIYTYGCESCENGSIIANDDDEDGICNDDEIVGCTNINACNYNEFTTNIDNSMCIYSTIFGFCATCSGETDGTGSVIDNDFDNDNVCDENEIVGCQDATACNYNNLATDAGNCDYADSTSLDCQICSGETDGTGTVVLNDTDLDGVCDDQEIHGCTDSLYTEYSALATELDESCETLVVTGCTDSLAFNFSIVANTSIESCIFNIEVDFSTTGTNTTTNFSVTTDTVSLLLGDSPIMEGDIIGGFHIIEGQLYCAGFTTWTGNDFSLNLWMDDPSTVEIDGVTEDATIYWIVQQQESMFNYLVDLTLIQAPGITFVTQITLNDNIIIGCMDATAFNYNSEAFINDGACEDFIGGCLDTEACNYDDEANTEDNTCYYITANILDFQNGQPLTVVTDAENPTFVWLLGDLEQEGETTSEFTPYINGLYTVNITDESGCSISDSYTLDNIGLDEYTVNQLKVYPNPAVNYVQISSSTHKIETLKIVSITGKVLQEYKVDAFQFKLERNNLANGIYFLKATINNRQITKQVIFK